MQALEILPPSTRSYVVTRAHTSTSTGLGEAPVAENHGGTLDARLPLRTAWIEINLAQLRRNFQSIHAHKPAGVNVLSVVKDDGYGHGIVQVARVALACGSTHLAVSTLHEAMILRDAGISAPILLLGQRHPSELSWCIEHNLTVCLNDIPIAEALAAAAERVGRRVPVHVKVDTGMARYGVRWTEAPSLLNFIAGQPALELEGVASHFAQSDEADKSYARLQLARFNEVLDGLARRGQAVRYRHLCNSGGFLDLPEAHFDMVRLGLLPFGVWPSQVCRRLPGILPVMTVKTRIAGVRKLEPGDCVGYGMRYQAKERRRIAVLPVGYGDGYPRVHNTGRALVCGRRAPVLGGNAMDATMVDITDIPEAGLWTEAVLMGRQGDDEITAHDVARWKGTFSYEVLVGWRSRLPRVYLDE
jgi:alanine racemase